MKKAFLYILIVVTAISCGKESEFRQGGSGASGTGYLCFNDISVDVEVLTKATVQEAPGNYVITILDEFSTVCSKSSYQEIKASGSKIALKEGNYTLIARSCEEEIPAAEFDNPIYGTEKSFSITAGQETAAGELVCKLMQVKVTVSYSDDFLEMVTGDGAATVFITKENPLVYELEYNDGDISYQQEAGYFRPNNGGNTTMEITYAGYIEGKLAKMTKVFESVTGASWHQIKFVKKVNEDGNADFDIVIDNFIEDQELSYNTPGFETVLGADPKAPKGDGGIKLESTCSYNIAETITVPAEGNPFVLTMKATVPGKVRNFTVEVTSTNATFVDAVKMVNGDSNVLDLVNPSAGAIEVFTTILPFPYGDAVKDKEEISFDLSDAQKPILAFSGEHSFTMHVTDKDGCRKDISVTMAVN